MVGARPRDGGLLLRCNLADIGVLVMVVMPRSGSGIMMLVRPLVPDSLPDVFSRIQLLLS